MILKSKHTIDIKELKTCPKIQDNNNGLWFFLFGKVRVYLNVGWRYMNTNKKVIVRSDACLYKPTIDQRNQFRVCM